MNYPTFCLIFFFHVGIHVASAQHTIREGRSWSMEESFFGQGPSLSSHKIAGDTIINGIDYKHIHSTVYSLSLFGEIFDVFAAREDTVAKKVFLVNSLGEFLGYDFSLEVGDPFYLEMLGNQPTMVVEVDSVVLSNGEMRKRMFMGNDVWVEGIGSMYGLQVPFFENYITDVSTHLACMYQDTLQLWMTQWMSTCGYDPLSTTEPLGIPSLLLYPNPAHTEVVVRLPYNASAGDILELCSADGKPILQRVLGSQNEFRMSIGHLNPGLYLVRWQGHLTGTSARLVVQ